MIRKIQLVNFQSHANTDLDLAGFTALVGPSSSGKTSVIRALNWLFYGEWDDEYPANKERPTAVAIELEDGTKVVRLRHKDKNQARIIRCEEDKNRAPMKDFGAVIPGLFDLLNVRPIRMGKKSANLNFALQKEPLFLISNDPYSRPSKAQWLGRLYGSHVVNSMMRLMASDKKSADGTVKDAESGLESLRMAMKGFVGLEAAEASLGAAEASFEALKGLSELQSKVKEISNKEAFLSGMANVAALDVESVKRDISILRKLLDIREGVSHLNQISEELQRRSVLAGTDISAIKLDISNLQIMRSIRVDLDDFFGKLQVLKARAPLLRADLNAIRADLAHLKALRAMAIEAASILEQEAKCKTQLPKICSELKRVHQAIKDKIFASGECPLCRGDKNVSAEDLSHNLRHIMSEAKR